MARIPGEHRGEKPVSIGCTLYLLGAPSTLTSWRSAATTAAHAPHAATGSLPRRSAAWAGPGRAYATTGLKPRTSYRTSRPQNEAGLLLTRSSAASWTGACRGGVQRVRRAVDAQGRGVEGAAQVGVPPAALVPGVVGHRVGDLLRYQRCWPLPTMNRGPAVRSRGEGRFDHPSPAPPPLPISSLRRSCISIWVLCSVLRVVTCVPLPLVVRISCLVRGEGAVLVFSEVYSE